VPGSATFHFRKVRNHSYYLDHANHGDRPSSRPPRVLRNNMNKIKAIAGIAAISFSAVGLVACSSGGGSSASTSCDLQLSSNGTSVYMVFTDSGAPVSASECQQINSDGGQVAGVSSSVISSLPANLSSDCTGSESGDTYTVYSDGTPTGEAYASAVCSSIQNGS
jgi:hypothetical protein